MDIQRVDIGSIVPDPANVRLHDERNIDAIKASLARFGQQHPLIVDQDNVIRAGNGRYQAMKALGWKHVDIVRTHLKGAEATAFAIADNRTAELATWDDAALMQQLKAIAAEDETLRDAAGYDAKELEAMAQDVTTQADNPYTAKMELPIYQPTGDCPPVSALMDRAKTLKLLEEIANADMPDEVRDFLASAAERHTVFNFSAIAEYYAHASADMQRLMEDSALVIIDFDKALENGLIHITKEMGMLAKIEGDEDE
jgi:hypothetical protein